MRETSKAVHRRLRDVSYVKWFAGVGIDVGSGDDPLGQWRDLFPLMRDVREWDMKDGDAQYLAGIEDCEFDFLHSSHCLEHLRDPLFALQNWCRVVRPGGYLTVMIPDEDAYEQGVFPSRWNADHKHTFTTYKPVSWCGASINVLGLICAVSDLAFPIKMERLESTWLPNQPGVDQTLNPVGECAIEFVLRKL